MLGYRYLYYLLLLLILIYLYIPGGQGVVGEGYSIDVISQDSVIITSEDGNVYRDHIDSIQVVILNDNL
jgi:hypothetical protein